MRGSSRKYPLAESESASEIDPMDSYRYPKKDLPTSSL